MSKSFRLGWLQWALAASALSAYWACQEEGKRPGAIGACGEDCVGGPSPVLNPPAGTPGGGGSASTGGNGGGANAGTAGSAGSSSLESTLSGSIEALAANLTPDPNVNGTVKVQAAGVTLGQVSVTSDPSGAFRLAGVSAADPLWVGVGLFTGEQASPFVDTLQPISTPLSLPVQLLVMRRSALQEIVGNGFLVNATELDSTRGHVILRFIDDQRQGISGATLVSPNPTTTSVAYDAGESYSDQRTETDLRGTMVLLNLASGAYPGTASTIAVRALGTQYNLDVRIATGAVTIVTKVIPR
jgi:hypothetical protein